MAFHPLETCDAEVTGDSFNFFISSPQSGSNDPWHKYRRGVARAVLLLRSSIGLRMSASLKNILIRLSRKKRPIVRGGGEAEPLDSHRVLIAFARPYRTTHRLVLGTSAHFERAGTRSTSSDASKSWGPGR